MRAPAIGPIHKLARVRSRETLCGRVPSTVQSISREWFGVTCWRCFQEIQSRRRALVSLIFRPEPGWLNEPLQELKTYRAICGTCTYRARGYSSDGIETDWIEFSNGLRRCTVCGRQYRP